MCGITGIFSFNLVGKFNRIHVTAATMALEKRGPDFQDIFIDDHVALGHRRLSIIDTSSAGNQPMWDTTGRYCIIFNGEIFNFRELRNEMAAGGIQFRSASDTEVLLNLYIRHKDRCLERLNGFFAFCIYDKLERTFFIARDRYGIKPLLYLFDEDKFIFSSEMKTILRYGIDRTLDYTSLYTYLHLNYIPAPATIFRNVRKLLPGHWMKVSAGKMEISKWYDIPYVREQAEANTVTYEEAQKTFAALLEASVQRRLVADVPLGAFLSGGVDSSVVAGLASRHKPDLHTFSIGFRDQKFFDETDYARIAARHFNTKHTVFSLTNDDLYQHVHAVLDYIDEPFADSSAINVYILSRETRKHATVSLSGDGADELLGGYNKHAAFLRISDPGFMEKLITAAGPLWKILPQSRSGKFSNAVRQLRRFAEGSALDSRTRYWRWAGFTNETEIFSLLLPEVAAAVAMPEYNAAKSALTAHFGDPPSINDVLYSDMKLVLANDMLMKVDLMSMANSLEVRVPFLDYELVNYCFTLPSEYKIDRRMRKKILQDAFREMLPPGIYNRPKKGFEVPLLQWFRREMRSLITDDLLSKKKIEEQGIFHYPAIEALKRRLFSGNPGDVHARIWGLIVFQWWWRRFNV